MQMQLLFLPEPESTFVFEILFITFWVICHFFKEKRFTQWFLSLTGFKIERHMVISFLIGAGFSLAIVLIFGSTINPKLLDAVGMLHSIFIAPVSEELFFRGMVVGVLLFLVERFYRDADFRWWFFVTLSVLSSSLFFSLMHGVLNWGLLVSGIIYACLYIWRRNVALPISAHFGYNLVMWVHFTIFHLVSF